MVTEKSTPPNMHEESWLTAAPWTAFPDISRRVFLLHFLVIKNKVLLIHRWWISHGWGFDHTFVTNWLLKLAGFFCLWVWLKLLHTTAAWQWWQRIPSANCLTVYRVKNFCFVQSYKIERWRIKIEYCCPTCIKWNLYHLQLCTVKWTYCCFVETRIDLRGSPPSPKFLVHKSKY